MTRVLSLGVAFLALTTSAWSQAAPSKPWMVSGGVATVRLSALAGWTTGPDLAVRRHLGQRWGLSLRAALPLTESKGAALLDLGPTISIRWPRSEIGLRFGATAFLVGEQSELTGGGLGGYLGLQATIWLSPRVGLIGTATGRVGQTGPGYFDTGAGLAIRF